VIYSSQYYLTALLEKLGHGAGELPDNHHYIAITIPNGVGYEALNPAHLSGWDSRPPGGSSTAYGETWQHERRSLVLIVPSVIAQPDNNVPINPEHPDFGRITHSLHQPVWWDRGLFGPPS